MYSNSHGHFLNFEASKAFGFGTCLKVETYLRNLQEDLVGFGFDFFGETFGFVACE